MTWYQTFEPVKHENVMAQIVVKGWPDEANRQLTSFVRDLIARGPTLRGYSEGGERILGMSARIS